MHKGIVVPGYLQKWVCKACGADHFYLPADGECKRCSFTKFEVVEMAPANPTVPVKKEALLRLGIDKYRLDLEWLNQPTQYYAAGERQARAQMQVNQCSTELDVLCAKLGAQVRDNPEDYGINRLSNEVVKETIWADPRVAAVCDKINQAKYELDIAKAAVNALEHRKRALTMLVELYTKEYYADRNGARERYLDAADSLQTNGGVNGSEETPVSDFEKSAVRLRGHHRLQQELRTEDGDEE